MYIILISWNSPTVKMFGSAPLMFKPTNESASVRGNLATTLQRSFIFKRIVREWVPSTSNGCSYVNDTKGSGQRRGQRSEVKGPAEVINVMNTPESEGRGHSEEHSGLPRLPLRHVCCPQGWSIIERANQRAACVCLHHACSLFTRVLLPRQHRL